MEFLFYYFQMAQTEQETEDVQIEDYNVKIDGQNVFDHPVKSDMRTYNNTQKIETGQGLITQLVVY